MKTKLNRRQFLGVTALTATVPTFLWNAGRLLAGDPRRDVPPLHGLHDNHVLVVVQLAGGNDGLNTVVPFADDAYAKARPKLAIDAKKVHKLDDRVGLHPEMTELKRLYDDGGLAVVQNVGYPNPNRSHFRATEIWETASPSDKVLEAGWLGRYFDAQCKGAPSPMLGMQVGERPAQAFAHPRPRAVTLANPDLFQWPETGPIAEGLDRLNRVEKTGNAALDFVQRSANETLSLSRRIQDALKEGKAGDYASFNFSQSLKLVAQMIAAEVPTRVYYVSLTGFDTHATQANRHAALLQELSEGLATFARDLKRLGQWNRVLTMTFSEFGRRLPENESGGTDHGTASVMFLAGGGVKPGLHGTPPDLTKFDESGDPKFAIDFRTVYAGVLRDWLNADPAKVLDGRFESADVVRTQ